MTIDALVDSVRAGLRAQVDAEFQRGQFRFFQEQVQTYGVRGPAVKRVAAEVYRTAKTWPPAERNQFCARLWESGMLEEGAVAVYFYRRLGNQCGAAEFRLFEKWIDRYVRNYAVQAQLVPTRDAIAIEDAKGPYANLIVVRAQDKDKAWVSKLVKAFQSPEVRKLVDSSFGGSLVAAF